MGHDSALAGPSKTTRATRHHAYLNFVHEHVPGSRMQPTLDFGARLVT